MAASRTLGRYELISELAKGQLGSVWSAKATDNDGNVKLAMIRRVPTSAPVTKDEIDLLSEGAWWALELVHDNVAHTTDVVMVDGELGVAMTYVEGEVLRSLLRLASFKRKAIPVSVGARIALDALDAIQLLSADAPPASGSGRSLGFGGLVPDSVLVGSDGITRVMDAGVSAAASHIGPLNRHPEMTAYAAPEQLAGEALDERASVYAVGAMLWEMLAGKRLYVGSTQSAVAEKVKAGGAARLDAQKPVGGDTISEKVADVIEKALSVKRDDRYESAQAFVDALREAADVADHETVGKFVEELAGNTLSTRRKVLDRATHAGSVGGASSAAKPAAARPAPPKPTAAQSPKPPARIPKRT
ncbi:MAG TPA: protein kinase, partial [Polyangiaceae bacterium]|nr:protein kinase [Polyangiaceae bacterium]